MNQHTLVLLMAAYQKTQQAIATIEKIPKLHTRYETVAKLARLDQNLARLQDELEQYGKGNLNGYDR
jgi:hypothetical protein